MQIYLYINHHYSKANEAVFFLDGFWCREKKKLFFYSIYYDPIKNTKYIIREKDNSYKSIQELLDYYGRKIYQNITTVKVSDISIVFSCLGKRSEFFFDLYNKYKDHVLYAKRSFKRRKQLPIINLEDIHYSDAEMHKYMLKEDDSYSYYCKWSDIYGE